MFELNQLIAGKYRLVRVLGEGGMGTVYEANHEGLGTRVAIKVLHGNLARRSGLVDRFLREARISAQIRSPNVVNVMDVDRTDQGDAYIVMELLEGEPLSSLLERERRVPIATACEYTTQMLEALEAAHALGVVHRDLKPENVFLTFVAGRPVIKLIDFGIAKAQVSEPNTKSLTVAGMLMGTAEYMAPEQAYSADKVDARSDIYAVGVMLYEMLSGVRPVQGEDGRIIALKVERGEVQPLVHAMPEVPRELAGLVHRAMAARPELRFSSASEMRIALEGALGGRGAGGGMAGPKRTGTLNAAPAFAAAVASAAQQAAPQKTSPGVPVGYTPAAGAYPPAGGGYGPPAGGYNAAGSGGGAHIAEAPKRTPRKKQSSTLWLLIAVPLLVGAGVVVMLVINSEHNARPDVTPGTATPGPQRPPAPTSPTAPTEAPTVAPTATAPDTVAPLNPTTVTPPAHPHPAPHPSASGSAAPSAAASTGPAVPTFPSAFPTAFPSTFPSSFPNPFPNGSGVGPMITIPTNLPFPIPGMPTAAPPAPSATATAGH